MEKKKKKSTRQRLLESAAVVFTEKGYANASVAEICDLAGANIASVNYHFRCKEALYQEVLAFTEAQARELYPFPEQGMPEERLYGFIFALLQRILSPLSSGNFYSLIAKEMAEPTTVSGERVAASIARHRSLLKELIIPLCPAPPSEELLFRLLFSTISQCLFFSYNEKGRRRHLQKNPIDFSDAEIFARHIFDFSLAGIRYCSGEKN